MTALNLAKVLNENACILDCKSFESKAEVFEFLAQRFEEGEVINCKEDYIAALYERESIGSTYMGNYIALPHGKSKSVQKPGIGFCRCNVPFVYESAGETGDVKFVFMLAIPETQSGMDYMKMLAKLAGLLAKDEFLNFLYHVNTYDEFIEEISKYER